MFIVGQFVWSILPVLLIEDGIETQQYHLLNPSRILETHCVLNQQITIYKLENGWAMAEDCCFHTQLEAIKSKTSIISIG